LPGLILTFNAGSSTLKCGLYEVVEGHAVERDRRVIEAPGPDAAHAMLDWAEGALPGGRLAAVGHRVVHGAAAYSAPVRITPEVTSALEALSPLAPLHQPRSLEAVRAVASHRPGLVQVACFDTAFHHTQPAVATWLGLPRALHEAGVRRYGFHGLSYQSVCERLAALDPALPRGRLILAHLGSGASLCAVQGGRSIDTSMGFSPLDGLLMSTRPGALDAGAVLYLLQHEGLDAAQVEDLLYRRSGLLGVSGLSGDMRVLLASPESAAAEAVELFVYRAVREAGALASALGGVDGVVFTGGVGENSPDIRARIAGGLGWLGLVLDPAANVTGGEACISRSDSPVAAWVIPTDEELAIARQTLAGAAE